MIIFLIVFLSFNSYAWFIFATKVETGINAKVRAWNVLFEVHDEELVEHLVFNVEDTYPGMANFIDYATVSNGGDCNGLLTFKILNVSILGEEYVVDDVNYTSDGIIAKLANDYPFKVSLYLTNSIVVPNSEESFVIDVSWPYESGNDELDTIWGIKAYDYNQNNPGSPSIKIEAVLQVTQSNS